VRFSRKKTKNISSDFVKIKLLDIHSDLNYLKLSSVMGSVFNSTQWLSMYEKSLGVYGIYDGDDKLIGSFFQYNGKKKGLKFCITPPFTPSNGLFFENKAKNKANRNSFEKGIMQLLADHFDTVKGSLLVSAFPSSFTDMQPFIWKKQRVAPRYTYVVALDQSEEQLLENLTSEKRKSLRRAEKDEVSISACDDMKIIKKLVEKTFDRREKKLNAVMLDKILFEFASKENSFAYIARKGKDPIACTFCVHDSKGAYYLFGGYDESNKHHGAGVSTMWQSILHAKNKGLEFFDFEGSMIPEVERYFREFGGKHVVYFEVNKTSKALQLMLNK